jgi:death-on-curing protein
MKRRGLQVEMAYLTVEEVLYIHEQVIKAFGGSHGVRDMNLVESAVHRPAASFAGEDLYPNLWTKAAAESFEQRLLSIMSFKQPSAFH